MRLNDKVSLITGSSRGIGRSIALSFAREGSDIAINCSTSLDEANRVAQEIRDMGRRAIVVQADIASKAQVDQMVNKLVAEFGKLDILVNNAGMSVVGVSADLEESRWRRGIDVLLTGAFFCSQVAGRQMIKQSRGNIINIASLAGLVAIPLRLCYSCAKAGVIQLTKGLACEWARYGINVNAIAPGYIRTQIMDGLMAKGLVNEKEVSNRTPAGRLGECQEIADAAVFLASKESRFITGQVLTVDGGWTTYGYLESWLVQARQENSDGR